MSNKSFVIRYIIAAVIVIAVGSGIFFAVFSLTEKQKLPPAVSCCYCQYNCSRTAFPEAATAQSLVVNGTAINDSRNSSPAPKLKNSYSVSSLSYTFDF
jgi:PP-loop superfamily ATP-utilizing enzyme